MMKCEKCASEIPPDEIREHAGRTLCEDCYLEIMVTPKTCDPWAVHSAKNTVSKETVLTERQQKIFDLIKAEGLLPLDQILTRLGISEEEFRRNFATLRHMELAKACKMEGQVCYTLFNDSSH
ncbi:MAG: DeoR family transcriptional regulator [Deltaproteobacteria bacterium]|nr:DeoR family transcriptional regulator [Deltaproteobacteria bacterium]